MTPTVCPAPREKAHTASALTAPPPAALGIFPKSSTTHAAGGGPVNRSAGRREAQADFRKRSRGKTVLSPAEAHRPVRPKVAGAPQQLLAGVAAQQVGPQHGRDPVALVAGAAEHLQIAD